MDFLNELFGSEMGELKRHQKTEEEIKKFCTSEEFTELKRAVHLLKKGYEIQKISVINHLDRYLHELGANELLLQIIIDSMTDWDYKMQIECANSFISPIKQKLIDQKNMQKILKFAVEILVSEDSAGNEQLVESWHAVFDVIVGYTDIQYCIKSIFPVFMEMPSLKNPLPKRKKGNRMLISFAKQIGEVGFDKEPAVLKQVLAICHDNNYKIRMDGILFFKDYLKDQPTAILTHPRFKTVYISELLELLNDEEGYIRIEALEILTFLLDQLEPADIENEFVKEVLRTTTADVEEIQQRLAELIGRIVFKLEPFDLHIKHKETFLMFYKQMVNHKELKVRRYASFNLPCFNKLYKDHAEAYDIDFKELYLRFSKDDDSLIVKSIAASMHEAFQMTTDEGDTQKLRDAFKNVMEMNNRETLAAISENLDVSLLRYCNQHAVKTYAPLLGGPKDEPPVEMPIMSLKKLHTLKPPGIKDPKLLMQKKITGLNLGNNPMKEQELEPLLPFITPENMSEVMYADLMTKLLLFDQNLQNVPGLWRSQIKYLSNLSKGLHLFNMPEFQEHFLGSLFEYIKGGTSEIRQAAADCIVKILQHQYNSAMRQELIQAIKSDLADSSSCVLRKTFIFFCKSSVNTFSRSFFKQHFLQSYVSMSKDKVAAVRMEFAHSLLHLKPYLELTDPSIGNDLLSLLTQMHSDVDRDVVEAVETCDYALLQMRKKTKEEVKIMNNSDQNRVQQEAALLQRETKEEEERKKRSGEEEETKFDFSSMMGKHKFRFRGGKISSNPFTLGGRKIGGVGSVSVKSGAVNGGPSLTVPGSSKGEKSSLLTNGSGGGASSLGGAASGNSSAGGDKTPSKKKTAAGTSTGSGSGIKKADANFSTQSKATITSGSGMVIGGSSGGNGFNTQSSLSQKQTGVGTLGVGGSTGTSAADFNKRHSVLVTNSSQSMNSSIISGGIASGSAAKAGKTNAYGRKSSFMGNE